MKNIFIFLVVINAVFASYVFWGNGALASEKTDKQLKSKSGNISSLALLSELSSDEIAHTEKPEQKIGSQSNGFVPAGGCILVGEFDSLLYAEYFLEKMIPMGVTASIKKLPAASAQRHSVLVHPFGGQNSVFEILFKVQEMGYSGTVVSGADGQSHVALGDFEQIEDAYELIGRANRHGIKTFIYTISEIKESIWVELDLRFGGKIDEEVIKFASDKNNYIEIRQNVCLGIANS